MKKRVLLLSGLLLTHVCAPFDFTAVYGGSLGSVSHRESLSSTTVAVIVSAILAAKIGYDVSWHANYTSVVKQWHHTLQHVIAKHKISSVQHEALRNVFSQADQDSIVLYNLWLNNSYNSWFCPWNWTSSQKATFYHLQTVAILTLYADLVALGDAVTGHDVVQIMRNKYVCVSSYPLIYGYDMIQNHCNDIRSNALVGDAATNLLLSQMVSYLQQFAVLLRQEKDYTEEVQMRRTHDLQKELIGAVRTSRY